MADLNTRFQFRLSTILLLTTVSAAILALLRSLKLPPLVYLGFAFYAILFSGYLLLRGFFQLRRSFQLRKEVRTTRRELSDWVDERRQDHREQVISETPAPTSNEPDEAV